MDFCNMCCVTLSKDVGSCVTSCSAATTPADMPDNIMKQCASQTEGENNAVKLSACKSCCDKNFNIYVTESSKSSCMEGCYKK